MNYEFTNIVSKEKLREVQLNTLGTLAEVLSKTAGPIGSNTQLLHGNRYDEYTKDGHNVLSQIKFYRPLENAIQQEMKEVTRYIVKTVGDGTTSAVLLSNEIFKSMCDLDDKMDIAPYRLMKVFKSIVDEMIEKIRANKRECTLNDIFNIALIATNGNTEVAYALEQIYSQYGMDVFIDVSISNTSQHLIKAYDGLTLDIGYPTPAYINKATNPKDPEAGKASIRNPKIYAFEDPVDTPEMLAFFQTILVNNILNPIINKSYCYVPTVILVPSVSRDCTKILEELEKTLYSFGENVEQKPPVLIITQAKIHEEQFRDITMLCGVPAIQKFLDPDIQKEAIERGDAPSLETILDWCGSADLVEADTTNTKFVNPKDMFTVDEEGNRVFSNTYKNLINYIEQELEIAYKNNEDNSVTGSLKRRLNSLKTNLVEYLIGGITVTDRDSVRDLVEDAVLNCRSAAKNGFGYGANFEGFRVINKMANDTLTKYSDVERAVIEAINDAYYSVLFNLYCTLFSDRKADEMVVESLAEDMPYNLATESFDGNVLCSIETDVAILEVISKVVMVMFTANQALLESPINNVYLD